MSVLPVHPEPVGGPRLSRAELTCAAALSLLMLGVILACGPRDNEEYALGVFSTQWHVRELVAGRWSYWLNDLGFGTPMPIGHRLDFHPAFALGSLVSLRAAMSVMWVAQTLLSAVYVLRLAAALGVGPRLRLAALASYLFSAPTIGWFYTTDWQTFVVAWTWFPLLVYHVREAALGHVSVVPGAIRLGLLFAFAIVNSHPGYLGPLFLILGIYAVALAPRRRTYAALGLAILLSVAMSSERIHAFASEMVRFPEGMVREQIQAGYTWRHYLDAAFFPATPRVWTALQAGVDAGPAYFDSNRLLRDPFFGLPLLIALVGAIGAAWSRRRTDPDSRAAAVAVVAAIGLTFVPPTWLLRVPSGSWLFRDPALFLGLLAATAFVQRRTRAGRLHPVVLALVAAQLLQQVITVWPAISFIYERRDDRRFYQRQGEPVGLAGVLAKEAATFGPRVYVSERVQGLARGYLSHHGLHDLTDLVFLGLNPVNAWFKSVSMDPVHPSNTFMHGFIRGDASVLANANLLDVLGVNLVVVSDGADQLPPGLKPLHRMNIEVDGAAETLIVLGNRSAWPKAALLAPQALDVPLPVMPGCRHRAALCRDYAGLRQARLPGTVELDVHQGHYRARVEPANRERLLFMPVTYREQWRVQGPPTGARTVPVAGAFLGVLVPAGVTEVDVAYVPTARRLLTWFSSATAVILLGALWFAGRRPERE